MRESVEKKLLREALRCRQLEIEQCLAEYGLAQSPRRPLREASAPDDDGRYGRLSAALVSLGPVFSSFGIYLSSRADLLPAKNCLELAAIPDRAEASPLKTVWRLISGEIGCPPTECYATFDEEPFESRLIFQSHRAQLRSGEIVTVKVVHPELEKHLACDLELLPLLNRVLVDLPLNSAVEDFRGALKQQTDFLPDADMMVEFAKDMARFETIKVPTVHRDFCTSRMLTFEHLSGSSLDDLILQFNEPETKEGQATLVMPTGEEFDSYDLASRLTLVWLRQSLQGRVFPVDPRPTNILLLPGQRIAFTGGGFASLPTEVKTNLLGYLVATVTQDPDRACSYLLGEMKRVKGAASEDELRHRFRRVVPFRDGGWSSSGDSRSLAEYLFVHWRLAREYGYRPQPYLLSFCRGLFQVAATARRLAPARDPMLEGLQDLRMEAVFSHFREMASLGQLSDILDKYAAMMTELPQRLNDALTLAAGGNMRRKFEKTESAEHRARKNSSAVVIALLLLLMAVALWAHHMAASAGAKLWVDRVGGIVFVLLGAMLLRANYRR